MENEILRLAEINEELLRSKGKLVQEIIDLKKQIIGQDKNFKLIEQLQLQVNKLNAENVEYQLNQSMLSGEIDELKRNLSLMELQKENLMAEMQRIQKLKWYQRLFSKK
jgi:hypothetical protein